MPPRTSLVLVLVALAATVGCVTATPDANCDVASVTLELTLTAESLAPTDPAVCRGQEVALVIESQADGVFHIHGYDDEVPAAEVRAGERTTLTFVAGRSGQFPIEMHPADDSRGVEVGVLTVREP